MVKLLTCDILTCTFPYLFTKKSFPRAYLLAGQILLTFHQLKQYRYVFCLWAFHVVGVLEDKRIPHAFSPVFLLPV